ncbi:tetratricopeptide repeat protein [Candidatus Protochlamydia phocaeensis]|uniref:tetratricopeptide repeat protein n=1 Tax=Candidatus Protochlamydia phocaeensis TaxID=1414722 RepID=UPI0008399731|nr:tetratricopeptide repeat protein [Candidatus Protochlamydia phocaeensis]
MLGESFDQFETYLLELMGKQPDGENILALSLKQEKEMYYMAYHLYRDQQFEDACHFFRLLVVVNPLEPKYWKGLGASLQMLQHYQDALNCYICTQILHRDQPDPYLYVYAADCYFALKQIPSGLKALEAARLSAEEQQDPRVLKHVALMKEVWSKQA